MNNSKHFLKKFSSKIIDILLSPYILIVIFGVLLIVAENIIVGIGVALFVFFLFYIILSLVRNANSKKTYIICLVISIFVVALMASLCIKKVPALNHNFGLAKNISNKYDIEYCLDKGIKNTKILPVAIKDTPYIETETISLRGQERTSDDGRNRFYYSIAEMQDVKLLFKHSTKELNSNKSIIVYLTKLDSNDVKVYNKIPEKNIYKAIAVYDEESLNSDLLKWRMFTIGEFLICLIAFLICLYIIYKYNEKYFLFYILSVKLKRFFKKDILKNKEGH